MDLASLQSLLSPEGQAALAEAVALGPDESNFLACSNRLGKRYPGPLVRSALSTAMLRIRARAKFRLADEMYFEREALEQSTGEAASAHRAARFSGLSRVADLCCGLGGDALALAEHADVVAVDLDPLRLALADLNLAAHGRRERTRLVEGDVLAVDLGPVEAAFVDPDRRVDGRRRLSVSEYAPALGDVLERLPAGLPVAAKVAPGVAWDEVSAFGGEVEFVSVGGELKECVLWLGPFRTVARRASVLPGGTLTAETPAESPGCEPPGRYLYDPDPAVSRAGLVTDLAHQLGAHQLDFGIAYLSGERLVETPFARVVEVEESMPFHLARLRDLLRERGVGRVEVERRGSPIEPEDLVRKLKLRGGEKRSLVLTRCEGRPWVLVGRRVEKERAGRG